MTTSEPISMYVPARNAARCLAECVASVRAQTRQPDEFIILADPRSSDDTVEVARKTGERVIIQKGNTLGAARNEAVAAAASRWVASCDSDVFLEPDWLERLGRRRADEAAGIGGRTNERIRSPFDAWRGLHMPHHWGDYPVRNPFMLVSEVIFDRDALQAIGGYREDLNYYEDSDLCQRLRQAGYALDYEPGAVATHQRTDTLHSLLDLRWKYSEYRQKHLLGDLVGLVRKLGVNREYTINTLSRSLAHGRGDLAYISFVLFFHHVAADVRRALVAQGVADTTDCQNRALTAACAAIAEANAELAGWTLGDLRVSPSLAPRFSVEGWDDYTKTLATAANDLCLELGEDTLEIIRASAAVIHQCASPDSMPTPVRVPPESIKKALQSMPPGILVNTAFCQFIRSRWPDAGEIQLVGWHADQERAAACEANRSAPVLPRVTVIAHLETRLSPCDAFAEVESGTYRLIACYRPPARFIPGLPVLSASDLASAAAKAGWRIEQFDTLIGHTRLLLSRKHGDGCPREAQPLETVCSPR